MYFSERTEMFFPAANRSVIQILNTGTEIITAGSAAAVFCTDEKHPGILCAVPATSDEDLWGIAAENIIPGTWGNVVLTGIVKAFISGGSGNYAVPSISGLTAADSGKAQIIYRGTAKIPGVIILGYASAADSVYTGQFSIRYIGNLTFEVRYGDTEYAGSTNFGEVPVQTITLPKAFGTPPYGSDTVRLFACCNENKYSVVIQRSNLEYPKGFFDYVVLGSIRGDGRVTQYYTSNDRIDFGRQWFL